jgi:putative ABC transport system permease protein
MTNLVQDLRSSARLLLKHPGFALTACLTLAIGIGATTALFSVVDAVLLRPLPYKDEERLVTLWQTRPQSGGAREETSPGVFLDWRERNQSCEKLAAVEPFGHTLTGTGEPERFRSWLVTEGFFDILGTEPLSGRTFAPDEHTPGRTNVVVIGYALWRQRFGGDPGIVGRTLTLNGRPHTIVGVMPRGFQYPPGRDLWAPREPREEDRLIRGGTYIRVVGRLKPGVTLAAAQAEMQAVASQPAAGSPPDGGAIGAAVVPVREVLVGQARRGLLVLFGAVGCVLLIACANIAGLLLARGARRTRELAIRAALGASRARLARELLLESLILSACGGAGGVILAYWLVDAVAAFAPVTLPGLDRVAVDPAACAFAASAALLSGLLFGLAPALRLTRPALQGTLKEEREATGGGEKRGLRQALIVAEMALALVLLAGAGLLVRSFATLLRVDPGFALDHGLTLEIQQGRNVTSDQMIAFAAEAEERIRALPGVRQAGLTTALPFHDNQILLPTTFSIAGQVAPPGEEPTAWRIAVTPGYLPALGLPLVAGRTFTAFDGPKGPPVALVNRTLARRHWPSADPVGQRIAFDAFGEKTECEIVGVVGDVRPEGLDSDPRPELYVPYAQIPFGAVTWLVRTAGDPLAVLPAVKEQIRVLRPAQPFASVATLEQWLDRSLLSRRFNLSLLAAFAAVALLLAAIGLYGLISYTMAQRTREIGIRMALGAQAMDVLRLVIGQGMRLALAGAGLGVMAALGLTRLLGGLLYGVSPTDPVTFAEVLFVLLGVAFLAALIPAVRASRLDPLAALRRG